MRTLFQKLVLILIICSIPAAGLQANAADTEVNPVVDGDLSLAKCVQQGNIDFTLFLQSTLVSDGFQEATLEPWRDVLFRNQCQSTDVLNLLQQRNKIRETIRDSFFTCQKDDIPQLKKAFTKLNMEIYYVRHVVDGKLVASLPFELLTSRLLEDPESLLTSSDTLYADMKDQYFDPEILDKKEFDQQFELLEKKYADRKNSYILCESNSWGRVQEKWEEFIDSAAGVGDAAKNFDKAVARGAEKIEENFPRESLGDYLKGVFAISINNLDPQSGVEGIVSDLSKDYADYGAYSSPTINDVITSLSTEEFRYSTDKLESEMRTKYTALYRDGGDGAIELFVDELVSLNEILKSSLIPIKVVEGCSSDINSRQCPGQ